MSEAETGPAMITGTISLADFRAAQQLHTRVARQRLRWFFVATGLGGLGLLALGYYLGGATLIIAALIGAQSGRTVGARLLEKTYAQHAALRSPLSYWWDADSISARNALGQSKRPWSSYVRVREDGHAFLLYQTDHLFEMVPKAWFTDPAQLEEFRRHAKPVA